MWQTLHPMDQDGRRDRLPAPHDPAQALEVVSGDDVELRHEIEDGGRREPLREPGFADELRQFVRYEIQLLGHQMQLGPCPKRAEDVERGKIEMQRRMLGDAI